MLFWQDDLSFQIQVIGFLPIFLFGIFLLRAMRQNPVEGLATSTG